MDRVRNSTAWSGAIAVLAVLGCRRDGSSSVVTPDVSRESVAVDSVLDFAAHAARLGAVREAGPVIRGQVVRAADGAGVPFADVRVEHHGPWGAISPDESRDAKLLEDDASISGRTDQNGEFTLRTAHPVLVTVRVAGFGPEAEIVDDPRDPPAIRLHLRPAVTLRVRVLDSEGAPIAGAHATGVGIEKTGGFRFWGGMCGNPHIEWMKNLGKTDSEGWLESVECYAVGQVALYVWHASGSGLFPAIDLAGAPSGSRILELRMPALCRLAVTVQRSDGSPCPVGLIEITRRFDEWGHCDTTAGLDEEGRCETTLGGAGRYSIELRRESEAGEHETVARRDVDLVLGLNHVELVDPSPILPPVLTSEDAESDAEDEEEKGLVPGWIEGHVVLASPDADPTDCRVRLLRDGISIETVELDEHGDFHFSCVAPGVYSATVILAGYVRFDSAPFRLESCGFCSLPEWTLRPSGALHGRIVDAQERGVPDARVVLEVFVPTDESFKDEFFTVDSTTTDDGGRFTLESIGVSSRLYVEQVGVAPAFAAIAADAGRDPSGAIVMVDSSRELRGRVFVPGGVPSATMKVRCEIELSPRLRAQIGVIGLSRLTLSETTVAPDGVLAPLRIPRTECEIVLWLNTSGWDSIGTTIARRHVDAGDLDVDLGNWWLRPAGE